jgi:TPR repeat protein
MGTRGQDIASMMIRVRRDVIAATGGFQVPWENSSLTRQFAFAPGAETASPEVQLWQLAGSSGDPALLRIYLERYPTGAHAADVRSKLEQTKMASLDSGASRSAPAGDPGADDSLWELARRVRVRPLVEFYLQRHPTGRHADAARELLGALPTPGEAGLAPETACERAATHPRDGTANAEGVPLDDLVRQADQAIDACRRAVRASPEMPHYKALLARALWAGKGRAEAIRLYREAADLGNLRAMVSLGLILESGDGVPRDVPAALALYERAAEGGSPDGAINLAVALLQGTGIARNPARAATLLTRASEQGSAIATYNLGVLAQDGVLGSPDKALGYFRRAIDLGDARGYRAAAILLDEGRGTRKAPDAAAEMLLRGVSADSGEVLSELTGKAASWSPDTLKAVQARLKAAGYYSGPVDGKGGTRLREPLQRWRTSGTPGPKGS